MAKIKHTKNELKTQRESLSRFERFLPMLQLKKQQLQAEVHAVVHKVGVKKAAEKEMRSHLATWLTLFSDPLAAATEPDQPGKIEQLISLKAVKIEEGNIAGIAIPIFDQIVMEKKTPDLFSTPTWYDDALDMVEGLVQLRIEREILDKQRELLAEELRVTSQRVNLFEKVKIPECKENIRVIKIFLGDEQTAAVARAKIAKNRTPETEERDEAA